MLALYRSGRQAEALEVYRGLARRLSTSSASSPERGLQTTRAADPQPRPGIDAPATPPPVAEAAARATAPRPEHRRVTVLFAALAATNELDEEPEETAAFFDRLHGEAAAEIEATGGTVEKGLVGALLATFGTAGSTGTITPCSRRGPRSRHAAG